MSSKETRIFYDTDADPARLHNRVVAVIGYGSQGHAHALNLRDSGVGARVVVGLRPGGGSWERARAEGLDVRPVAEAARAADVIMMLVPDQEARAVYEAGIAPALQRGKTLLFAHGFNIHFREIVPPAGADVAMVAPKSPGHLVRSEFQAGRGVPALVAVHQDASGNALADALAYAAGIGCAREWIAESRSGGRRFAALRQAGAEHPIEQVGAKLRAMMPWTEEGKAGLGGVGAQHAAPLRQATQTPSPEPLRA